MMQCQTTKNMANQTVELNELEENAIFIGINEVDIFKVNGTEFHHLFIVVLMKNPEELLPDFPERVKLFYSEKSELLDNQDVVYFDRNLADINWITTIGASSTCAYDSTQKAMSNLVKAPNYDRIGNKKDSKRILLKKIAINDLMSIKKILEFEKLYDNDFKYALVPELNKKGLNSNSFTIGALEYAGLEDKLEISSCFKTPGITKPVKVNDN